MATSRRSGEAGLASAPERRCPCCSRPLLAGTGRGRRRLHCSNACRQAAYRRRKDGEQKRRLITLLEGDAREFLRSLPSESADLIVTDPPYRFARGRDYFRTWFPDLPDDAWPEITSELYRVLKQDRHCYVFCDRRTHPIFEAAGREAGFRVHEPLIWDKDWLGLGGSSWRSCYELICFFEKGSRPGNSRKLGNVLRYRRPHRGYPTEKPVALLRTLIEQASHRGELVLDPFCGSGNTGRAARALARRAVLCDIDASQAARRLRNAPARLKRP